MANRSTSLERLLATKEIVVCCGPGGVGKTTVSAAAAAKAATEIGGKVLVLTIDPARRLADSLGVERLGNVATQVSPELLASAVDDGLPRPRGQLWAAMLDTRQSWDDLVVRHAPDAVTRDAILSNPLYQTIAGRFVQSHDYIAMERLYELHQAGDYDLIVVDTPPSRHALDFIEAPERMADFFSSRLLRWLTVPYRSRVVTLASKPFYTVADRILGSQFLEDIAEFFVLFQTMHRGFVHRAKAVTDTLHDRRTTFVIVTTLEGAPARDADVFASALRAKQLHVGGLVLNKVLPPLFTHEPSATAARRLQSGAGELAGELAPLLADADEPVVEMVLAEMAASFRNFSVVAQREAERRAELELMADAIVAIPHFETDIHDLAGLLRLARSL